MNPFDHSVLLFLNQFVGRWPHFDRAAVYFSESDLWKGGVQAALIWAAWFKPDDRGDGHGTQRLLVNTLAVCFLALIIIRVAATIMPFRVRPRIDTSIGFHFPAGAFDWVGWNSFPSDHAVLFCALAVSFCSISRRLGAIAIIHTMVVLLLRVYVGIHYPSDILAGAVFGIAVGYGARWPGWRPVGDVAIRWMRTRPSSFYPVMFLFTYELAVVFADVISWGRTLLHLARMV
jgi:membrane-associated phospholipid phosphatase